MTLVREDPRWAVPVDDVTQLVDYSPGRRDAALRLAGRHRAREAGPHARTATPVP
jgi:hypothetical protein